MLNVCLPTLGLLLSSTHPATRAEARPDAHGDTQAVATPAAQGGRVAALPPARDSLATSSEGQDGGPLGLRWLAEDLRERERARLADPIWNARVGEHLSAAPLSRLVQGVDVSVRAFESADDRDAALGLRFDLQKSLLVARDADSEAIEFVAHGDVAFERDTNPDDFVAASLRARWTGTHVSGDGATTRERLADTLPLATAAELTALDPVRSARLGERLAREARHAGDSARPRFAPLDEPLPPAEGEFMPGDPRTGRPLEPGAHSGTLRDPDFDHVAADYAAAVERTLPLEVAWDFDVHGGVEAAQDFSSRLYLVGLSGSARPLHFDSESSWSQLNVFDYPGALLRWLTGHDERFTPSGLAWPTFLTGLDLVDAGGDDSRDRLTDDRSYVRARFEATWRSRAFTLDGEPVHLAFAWRHYEELDAPVPVKAANLDESNHFRVELEFPNGLSLEYDTGRLPLDERSDSTFAVGYRLRF